ncbi:monooxygenase [Litchfieldella anticariensis FP35 = DSM 16096]|uniref:Monooxygenase n=1 Tax=Litchfieldella anticariensis (strain DSM 16096 / CECT 5854 / CIP 108499 / LMG 22089 / FP35) TaxID=1121939 RepID=S2KFF4_LITA3|nr:LLM class flavin-dependent oxidoreductase [Halomonas anticariensis]EPC00852.1 monooxygenase [Halomonas anticariensis FP35 = DSM 16096]
MQFSLFLHMERYHEHESHRQLFEELCELVKIAEAGGFRTAWIGEHHGMQFTSSPSPLAQLAYLAAKTERIRLGAGTFVAPFWDPIRLAGEAAMLDLISGGRLEFGIARGAYQYEFDRLADGMSAADGGQSLREMVPAMRGLWQGDYAHHGEVYRFPTTTSVPKPVQSPLPPMWIAARDPNSHDFAVKNGCNVMVTALMKGDEEVADLAHKFDTACANHPEVSRPELMLLRHTYVHEEGDPDGWQRGAEAINRFYRYFLAWFKNDQQAVNGFFEPVTEESVADNPEFSLDSLHRNMMIGTPLELVERLKGYEAMGITEYSFWTDNTLSFEDKKRSLELFIRDVMPHFR